MGDGILMKVGDKCKCGGVYYKTNMGPLLCPDCGNIDGHTNTLDKWMIKETKKRKNGHSLGL